MWYPSLVLKNIIPYRIIHFKIRQLHKKISQLLNYEVKLFVPIFSHKEMVYKSEEKDNSNWLSKYFFTAGIKPSDHIGNYSNSGLDFKAHLYPNGHLVSAVKPDADYGQIEDEELREAVELSYSEKLDFLLYGEYESNFILRDLEGSSYLLLPKNMFIEVRI